MESETVPTVSTVEENSLSAPLGAGSGPPALMFIGYGIAMVAGGQWMLEEGIKRAGGWKGVRNLLARVEKAVPIVEGESPDELESPPTPLDSDTPVGHTD